MHQWQVCADGNQFRALCVACDIALNELVLGWAKDPNKAKKMAAYRIKYQQPITLAHH